MSEEDDKYCTACNMEIPEAEYQFTGGFCEECKDKLERDNDPN